MKKSSKKKLKSLDWALLYCALMCTIVILATLFLFYHSASAPDGVSLGVIVSPMLAEIVACTHIKTMKIKNEKKSEQMSDEPISDEQKM